MRFIFGSWAVASFVVGCNSDSGLKKYNSEPEAFISSHATGDTVLEGVPEPIRGQVGDPNHAIEDLAVTWLLNGTETCDDSAPDESGVVTCEMTFGTDGGEVRLEVRDPEGAGASTAVTLDIQPTDAPVAEITAPAADGVYYSDQLITFEGSVSDTEDPVDSLTVAWASELDGPIEGDLNTPDSEGGLLGAAMLTEGEHFITLTVTDTTGKEGRSSTTIDVGPPNSNPTCAITAPDTGSAGPEGELVTFTGTAEDVDVASDWLSVAWSSDKDGPIGSSTPTTGGDIVFNYADLTVDTHTITMTVTDEIGATCSDLTVFTVGTPPVLNVTAPADGVTLNHSDAVVFEATVTDNEDLSHEVALSWESDIDGVFSTAGADSSGAATVSIDSLSPGNHVVTVTATDTDGLFVTDTVSFNLNQPPTTPTVTLEPNPAVTNQMLVATASGSEDPEGTGTVTYAYEWFEDGVATAESASATFPASATGKNHTYRVQVTASDGLVESAFGFAEVNVINSAPALSGPSLSAATAIVGDVLSCSATATDLDPEDSPIISYAWSDGSTGPSYTVTMTDAVDSTVTCTATADDADGGVTIGTASATVTNTAPTIDTVAVSPATGQVGDVLTCTATASDADGETPAVTYAWSDGSTGGSYTVTASDAVDSPITCTATATDMHGETGTGTASATVTNTAPTIDTVAVSPATGQVGDVLTCTATASDADGETPAITYAWSDGSAGGSYTITAADAVDSTITCTATATDAYDATGTGTASATVTNTAPVMGTVSISPDPAYNDDTLVCSATATDADGTSPTITYEWTGGATTTELPLTSIIAASGDTLTCTATATDAHSAAASGSASVTLGNRAPTVNVAISPESPNIYDTLTCTASGVSDPDDDATTLAFTWTIGGSPVAASSTSGTITTLAAAFLAGQTVACRADVDDGKGGTATDTGIVVIGNTAPVVSGATLTPSELYTNDTVTAMATVTDADGDEPSLTYAFSVDGTLVQDSADNTLDGAAWFDKGQVVTVTVTANDGTDTGSDASGGITVLNSPPTEPGVSVDSSIEGACDDGWTIVEGGDRCFKANFTQQNYADAEAYCVSLGGHLARISSDADNDLAMSLVYESDFSGPYTYTWIGGNRIDTSGAFEWTDGEPFDYTNWYSTEPTGAPDEQCIEIFYPFDASGRWNDDFCTQMRHSVCQVSSTNGLTCSINEESTDADGDPITYTFDWDVDGTPFTETDTTAYTGDTVDGGDLGYDETWTCNVTPNDGEEDGTTGSDDYYIELTDADGDGYTADTDCDDDDASVHPYAGDTDDDGIDSDCDGLDCEAGFAHGVYFVGCDEFITYDEANTACITAGYDSLAGIRNAMENDFVESLLSTPGYGADFWIGINDKLVEGTWRREDGELATYLNWGSGEPDPAEEDCAAMDIPTHSGGWIDAPCGNDRQGFVCEARDVDGPDIDGDGYTLADDCNDRDATIHPYAGDTHGDGIDSDCDRQDCEGDSLGDLYVTSCPKNTHPNEARLICEDSGYDGLASLPTAAENTFAHGLISDVGMEIPIIGLNDRDSEGVYVWPDGSPYSYSDWGSSTEGSDVPNDCVSLDMTAWGGGGGWADIFCGPAMSGLRDGYLCSFRSD